MTHTATVIEGLAAWELEHVAAINTYEEKADRPEAEASDIRWRQAEEVVAALDAGLTQQRLADNWKRSDGTAYSREYVKLVKKTWDVFGSLTTKPRWNVALNDPRVTGKGAHVGNNAGDNEWNTPPEYIDAARDVMGGIDLDPASSEDANDVIGASLFFTEDDDGRKLPWAGRVWMNPPYARPLIDDFCAKLAKEYAAGNVTQAITLTNNATETGWFHGLAEVATAMCFPRQRVKFWHPEKESAAPLQGQAVVYLGDHDEDFRTRFVEFGFTVLV